MFCLSACVNPDDGSLLVLDGDEDKNCSGLYAEYEKADQLSEQNIDARQRWLKQLMRRKDCRSHKQPDTKFDFHLTISG